MRGPVRGVPQQSIALVPSKIGYAMDIECNQTQLLTSVSDIFQLLLASNAVPEFLARPWEIFTYLSYNRSIFTWRNPESPHCEIL